MNPQLNIDFCRSQFKFMRNNKNIYVDNAGGSCVLESVANKVADYLSELFVQHGCGGQEATAAREGCREGVQAIQRLINAQCPEEICFGASTTQVLHNLSLVLEKYDDLWNRRKQDNIVITQLDHEANRLPWERLAEKRAVELREWRFDAEDLSLNLQGLVQVVDQNTKLVAFTHASNLTGGITDVKTFVRIIRKRAPHALILVDGTAYHPHDFIDVQDLGVDFYVFSLYKLYGPHFSCLYGRYHMFQKLPSINFAVIEESDIPLKFQLGKYNPEYVYAISELPRYWDAVCQHSNLTSYDQLASAIARHEQALNQRMLDSLFLDPVYGPKFELFGSKSGERETRLPFFSFVVKNQAFDAHDCVRFLAENKMPIVARPGHCGAPVLMKLLANQPLVRISLAHYNTRAEVDAIVRRLKQYVDSLESPAQTNSTTIQARVNDTVKVTY